MIKKAIEIGFCAAEIISTSDLVFVPEYRKYCEDNLCGNYGKNYGCPPICGSVEEMQDRVRHWKHALVLQTKTAVENAFDDNTTKLLKKKHTAMTLQLIHSLKELNPNMKGMPIMAGPCNLCNGCRMKEDLPCPHEEMKFSCLSAYCIDVNELVKTCHMDMQWSEKEVSLFSIWMFEETEERL